MARKTNYAAILIIIIMAALAMLLLMPAKAPVSTTGSATQTVNLTATITTTVMCSASQSALDFGTLTLGSDKTTSASTMIDAAGSNTPTKLTASVTNAASWITGFQSANTRWGILCPAAADGSASGLTNPTGYKTHKFSPSANTCRNPLGIVGATVGLGSGTIPMLQQKTNTHSIFSRINAPGGTTPGSYFTIVTFTCSEITGPSAGLSFEVADIEGGGQDSFVACDGGSSNVYVVQAGLGAIPGSINDNVASSVFVCDSNGNCVAAAVTQEPPSAPTCPNALGGGPPDEASTPNGADIACGTFICPAGLAAGAGKVIIETGPLLTPAGETVQSYFNVTIL